MTAAAGWSPRPGHQCVVALDQIVCFGGYGEPKNPNDIWASRDGKRWLELEKPASPPWRAVDPDDAKYDFDALVVRDGPFGLFPVHPHVRRRPRAVRAPAGRQRHARRQRRLAPRLDLAPAPLTGYLPAGPRQRSGGETSQASTLRVALFQRTGLPDL